MYAIIKIKERDNMKEFINDMRMEQDHEIMECDKIEYNKMIERVRKYNALPKELQEKYNDEFMDLVEKMDKLIDEMGVDNASTEEWKNGFELKGDK